jgi:hypothetical protein
LTEDNEYLFNLLAENGLTKFLKPIDSVTSEEKKSTFDNEGEDQSVSRHVLVRFLIDRNQICIRCKLIFIDNPSDSNSKTTEFYGTYPPYSSQTAPPAIRNLDVNSSPKTARIKELADMLWRTFCINDFLSLTVEAKIHTDGSMSFPRCFAQVDESAAHRQENIFKHVTRNEHPVELEAEKSLLVYRRYSISNFCSYRYSGGNIGTIGIWLLNFD